MDFESFGLSQTLLNAVVDLNWTEPTEIQKHVIPMVLDGKNVLAWARTGSGKTGAFVIPLIERILQLKAVTQEQETLALILTPTKELSSQAWRSVGQLTKYCSRQVRCVDVSAHANAEVLRPQLLERPDVVVGTPSAVLAQAAAGHLRLRDSLRLVVVDEADLVFSFGYEQDFEQLRAWLPASFQAVLVSATLGTDVKLLRKRLLRAGTWCRVELTENSLLPGAEQLAQYCLQCGEEDRFVLLYALIKLRLVRGKTLIFVNSVARGYRVRLFLEQFGIRAAMLNAELPLATRGHVVQQFNRGLYDNLIASDESFPEDPRSQEQQQGEQGEKKQKQQQKQQRERHKRQRAHADREFGVSRGVDFQLVSNVVNFDFPASVKAYVHRVGRTGRAGQQGTALSFVGTKDAAVLSQTEEFLGQSLRPFQFRMEELDGFRYRARDAMRAVTSAAVREARVREIRTEMLNSASLRAHFEDNPRDLHLLRHDKELHTAKVQQHLRHVPDYIVPRTLRDLMGGGVGKRRRRRRPGGAEGLAATPAQRRKQRKAADPLFSANAALQLGRKR